MSSTCDFSSKSTSVRFDLKYSLSFQEAVVVEELELAGLGAEVQAVADGARVRREPLVEARRAALARADDEVLGEAALRRLRRAAVEAFAFFRHAGRPRLARLRGRRLFSLEGLGVLASAAGAVGRGPVVVESVVARVVGQAVQDPGPGEDEAAEQAEEAQQLALAVQLRRRARRAAPPRHPATIAMAARLDDMRAAASLFSLPKWGSLWASE